MGYTHYWKSNQEIMQQTQLFAIQDIETILSESLDIIGVYEKHINQTTGEIVISFNGLYDYEDCVFTFPLEDFGFCKTGQRPYDKVVVACLCVLSESGLTVTSDGNSKDWIEGHHFAETILERKVGKPI